MENKSLIERHTVGDGDSRKVNAISAFQEIDVRLKTLHLQKKVILII